MPEIDIQYTSGRVRTLTITGKELKSLTKVVGKHEAVEVYDTQPDSTFLRRERDRHIKVYGQAVDRLVVRNDAGKVELVEGPSREHASSRTRDAAFLL